MGLMQQEIIEIIKLIQRNNCSSILMIGKQKILIDTYSLENLMDEFQINFDRNLLRKMRGGEIDSVELLKLFSEEVHALDYSGYEGADIIFDLNSESTPSELVNRFEMVIDGGTLEHVFNVKNAINHMNRFLKKDGIIYHMVPANGWMGHGFYNFSPSFFEDAYGPQSGFRLEKLNFCSWSWKNDESPKFFVSQDCRFFQTTKEMDSYLYNCTGDMKTTLLCVAQKMDSEIFSWCPMQRMYRRIYLSEEINKFTIGNILSEFNDGKSFALWGAGAWGERIFDLLCENGISNANLTIFDLDVDKIGKNKHGVDVLYPTAERLGQFEKIVICSINYENEIYEKLKGMYSGEIIRLSSYINF